MSHGILWGLLQRGTVISIPLIANMPNQDLGELSGKLLQTGESYTISFANVPPGTYEAICTPHLATGMKMKITVQ